MCVLGVAFCIIIMNEWESLKLHNRKPVQHAISLTILYLMKQRERVTCKSLKVPNKPIRLHAAQSEYDATFGGFETRQL